MAQITINIPNANLPEVADALAWAGRYQELVPDPDKEGQFIDNPVTKNQFAKMQVIKYMKNSVKEYRHMLALQTEQTDVDIT